MRGGIVVQWGPPLPGRERDAIEATKGFRSYIATLVKQGKVSESTELASAQGSTRGFTGIALLTGEVPTLSAIQADPQYQEQVFAMESTHRHFWTENCVGGDEASLTQHEKVREQAWENLGYL